MSSRPAVKPGICPRRKWGSGMCAEYCTKDSDCPKEEKCCHNGCGHECITPYTGEQLTSDITNSTSTWIGNKKLITARLNIHTEKYEEFLYTATTEVHCRYSLHSYTHTYACLHVADH